MVAKTIPGYASSLDGILEADDTVIPLKHYQELLNRLNNDGDWTTLLIQDTVGYEVIKAINFRGDLAIERGLSGTKPRRFPYGSCVTFAPSDELIKALSCETDCCENGTDDTFGDVATAPNVVRLEVSPTNVIGGINAVLGEPDGFMLINGKRIPYYD